MGKRGQPIQRDAEDFITDFEKRRLLPISLALLNGLVSKSLFDANTILYATTDNTPLALTIGASTIVGRKATGNIVALTGAEVLAILTGQAGAAFSWNSQNLTSVGDISIGANKLRTTNMYLAQLSSTGFVMYLNDGTTKANLSMGTLDILSMLIDGANPFYFGGQNLDNATVEMQARDNGVARKTVARLVGAADPYFEATLPMVLKPIATASLPTTPVEGMVAYDNTLNKLVVYNGAAWETVTSV